MPDRIEREIEEILARLDDLPEAPTATADRNPIPIAAARKQRQKAERAARPSPFAGFTNKLNPTSFLLAGATLVVFGLVLSSVWGQLIWAAVAGVVMFFGGFLSGFLRRSPSGGKAQPSPKAVFWRDRYISYAPAGQSTWERVKRRFGRR